MNPANARTRPTARSAAPRRDAWRQPMLLWALVMIVAMMSFYVHLLQSQVQRAEGLRQSDRAAASSAKMAKSQSPRTLRISQNTAR